MDKTAPGRWIARHPVICVLVMAVVVGAGPSVQLARERSAVAAALTVVAVVMGALFGLILSISARRPRKT